MFTHIYLFAGPTSCPTELLIGLAMSLIPALLGLLAARSFFKVDDLRENNARLTTDNGDLNKKVNGLTGDNTDLRLRITQLESDLDNKNGQVSKYRNDLILVESERNMLREQLEACRSAAAPAVASSRSAMAAPPPEAPISMPVEPEAESTPSFSEGNALVEGARARGAAAAPVFYTFMGNRYRQDDLKIVEGIGPKIEELLHAHGIKTWLELAETSVDRLRDILHEAGSRFVIHNPTTWPRQSMMAHQEDWDGLKKLQEELTAGKE